MQSVETSLFDSAIKTFLSNNSIDENCEDAYVKFFRQKVGRFLGQQMLRDNTHVKEIFLKFLHEYKYYSKARIEVLLKGLYNNLNNNLNLDPFYTIYSPIPSEKDKARENSSNFYLTKYLEVNDLESNIVMNINTLNLIRENEISDEKSEEELTSHKKLRFVKNIVLIDDFSGSGKTIKAFLKKSAPLIKRKRIILYLFHLTKKAEDRIIQSFIDNNYSNYQIIYEDKSDSIFDNSNYSSFKRLILDFENETLKSSSPLGFNQCASLVTFSRNCPNNTLSSYWYTENSQWLPLFPRKENKLDLYGKEIEKARDNIIYNLSIKIPNSQKGKYEYKDILTLMFLKDARGDSEKIELCTLLRYNNTQLQEHLYNLEKNSFISNDSLTVEGKRILKELKLFKLSLKELSKETGFELTEEKLAVNDLYIPNKKN